jgi:hypothetical protein
MRLRKLTLLIAVAVAVATTTARPALASVETRCSIVLEADGSFSASVVDMPLDDVLGCLAARTGTVIRWTAGRSEARSTLGFHRLSLTDAIARLLAQHNYAILWTRDAAGRARAEVRIGSPIDDATVDPAAAASAAPAPRPYPGAIAPDRARAASAAAGADDRVRLETVSRLVDLENGTDEESPLREVLTRALAGNDAADVERATTLGLGALPDDTLESAARSDDSLRALAVDLLARRAAQEAPALAALGRLAGGPADDETAAEVMP